MHMKLVKLDRRYKSHKQFGHNWAFVFSRWGKSARLVEIIFSKMYGDQQHRGHNHGQVDWRGTFQSKRVNDFRPYIVSFKNQSDATVVLLQLDQHDD